MKLGAATLINAWGRLMVLKRAGTTLVTFKGRMVEVRPTTDTLEYSVDQENQRIIADVVPFETAGVMPQKFDTIDYNGETYTVQRAHKAGADVDELMKFEVRGGRV